MLILKTGGGAGIDWDAIAQDLCALAEPCVVVHGANALMKEVSAKMGLTERFILSPSGHTSRYTDPQTLDVLIMVYAGLANKLIVANLARHGIPAVGLSGADGHLLLGKRKENILAVEGTKVKVVRDSATGKIETANASLLRLLLDAGYLPVVTVPVITERGELINVDNDRVTAVLARDLGADKVVMLFEAPGLLEDPAREDSRIPSLTHRELEVYLGKAEGRMKKKLLAAQEALSFGVRSIYFGDGRIAQPITRALKGEGTVIRLDA
jgi:acetylglutamate/LysW-gamma-L-alpha-aminoadipate kinase